MIENVIAKIIHYKMNQYKVHIYFQKKWTKYSTVQAGHSQVWSGTEIESYDNEIIITT